jgi:Family of unknown function (DUF6263)
MKKSIVGLSIVAMLSLTAFAKDKATNDGVLLKADYAANQQWKYTVEYTSQGNFRQKSSNTAKSTEIRCMLIGSKKDPRKLSVKADSVVVTSDVYTADLQKEIRDKLSKADYSLSLANGFPSIDTSVEMPANSYLEWDLYRQLSKLLPLLPAKPVKPGFAWERTDMFPMQTAAGKVSCEVYRNYTFNKLSGDTAMVSWKFRYAGSSKAKENQSAMNEIPVFGTGNGSATIDIKSGCILSAEMNFTTPVAVVGDVSIVWHENAVIKLAEVK